MRLRSVRAMSILEMNQKSAASGLASSTRLPEGSTNRICDPPGPVTTKRPSNGTPDTLAFRFSPATHPLLLTSSAVRCGSCSAGRPARRADRCPMASNRGPAAGIAFTSPSTTCLPRSVVYAPPPHSSTRTLVVGSNHSAINVALALMELQETDPRTEVFGARSATTVSIACSAVA